MYISGIFFLLKHIQFQLAAHYYRDKATGKVGMTPAVNLARLSDGSQSGDPVYSDISSYSHCNVYKKRTPPRR